MIQIQHLLLFNNAALLLLATYHDSNTTPVTVQRLRAGELAALQWGFKYNTCYCSTEKRARALTIDKKFKYNTCYCSTNRCHYISTICMHSNTTPVTVQLSLSQYPVVFAHIQIQHLLMFNCNAYFAGRGYVRIQTQHLLMFNGILIDRCAVSKLIQIQHLLMFNPVHS